MTVDFLWGERSRPTRGPKPALTLDRIAEVAIGVADAEGLAAVSMQRVAAELGYTKMSLYRYLPGKAELVAAMLERVVGEPPALDGNDWRAALTTWTEALLERYRQHGWAIEATTGERPVGPHELGWMESALAVLPPGLTGGQRMDTVAVLAGQVRMIAGQSEAAMVAAVTLVLREHAERFPAVVAAVTDPGPHDQAFHFGLERILDGIEVLIGAR
ncbi:TetR/AcrR family transcriptional regulator [Paractinoplanes lichenicola]|uniref:TetR/AcrR family transcriptional regulator C-terminal domain-containing protein n=1 Tax=Paractinoplanes lichenicola TaxID=2802976 RepID=A0ABS1VI89_9ACTN|nr:TetR/AcrR family transcriptional regulator [Actinoplanes lichenicola]MBL7254388.1 TetR/AcrR family transcriptional regulator C-terminal domain-containing protein [Actinoplanes lichenicola]